MPTFKTEDFEEDAESKELKLKDGAGVDDTEDDKSGDEDETPPTDSTPSSDEADTPKKNRLEEFEFSDEDLPEHLRGKVKTPKQLLETLLQTQQVAKTLFDRLGEPKREEKPAVEPEPEDDHLLTEDDLGVGANAEEVERKLGKLVEKRLAPLVADSLQKTSEQHLQSLLKNEEKYPYAKRFIKEIASVASETDLRITAKPEFWDTIYHQLVGANYKTLLEEDKKTPTTPKPKAPASEKGDTRSSGKKVSSGKDAEFEEKVRNAKLSPEEEAVIESMGIDRDAYIRRSLRMGYNLNGKLN